MTKGGRYYLEITPHAPARYILPRCRADALREVRTHDEQQSRTSRGKMSLAPTKQKKHVYSHPNHPIQQIRRNVQSAEGLRPLAPGLATLLCLSSCLTITRQETSRLWQWEKNCHERDGSLCPQYQSTPIDVHTYIYNSVCTYYKNTSCLVEAHVSQTKARHFFPKHSLPSHWQATS